MITFVDVEEARQRIQNKIYLSPFPYSETISQIAGSRVFFKLDNLQMTGSFKERGALNRLLTLTQDQAKRGVIAASAGNHGMAVAFHSQRLNIAATIVMPLHAPLIKVSRVRQYGAETVLHGADYDSAFAEAERLSQEKGLTLIHAFNDPWVVAGQGTIGLEILEQVPDLEAVIVPVGGGGLIAGIALAIKSQKPNVAIIGVEPRRAASFTEALRAGKPVAAQLQPTLADGLAIAQVGEHAFAIAEHLVDEMVLVDEHHIALAILRLLELEKSLVEGAGAAGLAACLAGVLPEMEGRTV